MSNETDSKPESGSNQGQGSGQGGAGTTVDSQPTLLPPSPPEFVNPSVIHTRMNEVRCNRQPFVNPSKESK
jgi:hypothetical protein